MGTGTSSTEQAAHTFVPALKRRDNGVEEKMKLAVTGDCSHEAKRELIKQYVDGPGAAGKEFDWDFLSSKRVGLNGEISTLTIENDDYYRFRRVECHVYRDASAVMLVDSFDGHIPWSTLKFLLQEVACVAPQAVILLVLVVDKIELQQDYTSREIRTLVEKQCTLPLIEVCTRTGENVDLAFKSIIREVVARRRNDGIQPDDEQWDKFDIHNYIKINSVPVLRHG